MISQQMADVICGQIKDLVSERNKAIAAVESKDRRIAELEAELERERMRLTACGIVALADTQESADRARNMSPDYRSDSCDDVARRVDECIALRVEKNVLKAENERLADINRQHVAKNNRLVIQSARSDEAMALLTADRYTLKELLRRVIHYCDNTDVTGVYTDYEKAPECDLYSSGLYEKCKSILAEKEE